MPYIKVRDPYKESKKLLRGYEVDSTRLMAILDCSRPTAQKKLKNPGKLTGDEWLAISRKAHIPIDEIRLVFLS